MSRTRVLDDRMMKELLVSPEESVTLTRFGAECDNPTIEQATNVAAHVYKFLQAGTTVRHSASMCHVDIAGYLWKTYSNAVEDLLNEKPFRVPQQSRDALLAIPLKDRRQSYNLKMSHYKELLRTRSTQLGIELESDYDWFAMMTDEAKWPVRVLKRRIDAEYINRMLEKMTVAERSRWDNYMKLARKYTDFTPAKLNRALKMGYAKAMEEMECLIANDPRVILRHRKTRRKGWWHRITRDEAWMDGWSQRGKVVKRYGQ